MPERQRFERRRHIRRAPCAAEPGDVFRQHGLRLCGIDESPSGPSEKNSSGFQHLGALEVAELGSRAARPKAATTPRVAKYMA